MRPAGELTRIACGCVIVEMSPKDLGRPVDEIFGTISFSLALSANGAILLKSVKYVILKLSMAGSINLSEE